VYSLTLNSTGDLSYGGLCNSKFHRKDHPFPVLRHINRPSPLYFFNIHFSSIYYSIITYAWSRILPVFLLRFISSDPLSGDKD